jgi:hypothetical protein
MDPSGGNVHAPRGRRGRVDHPRPSSLFSVGDRGLGVRPRVVVAERDRRRARRLDQADDVDRRERAWVCVVALAETGDWRCGLL